MLKLPSGQVFRYTNVAAAMAVMLLIVVGISTACNSSSDDKKKDSSSSAAEVTVSQPDETEQQQPVQGNSLTGNYKYVEYQNGISLGNGYLVTVDEAHPFTGLPKNQVQLYGYMFDPSGAQIMYGSSTVIEAEAEMLDMFNELTVGFVNKTGLTSLMVYGLIPEDEGQPKTDEAFIGTCVDLMTYDQFGGYYGDFTGEGDYAWVPENCYRYGFVMRDTDRLRYVGKAVSEYIHMMNSSGNAMDLGSFMTSVKSYSFDSPLMFADEEDNEYAVYYVGVTEGSDTTSIPVPLKDNDKEYKCEISGNNIDGYVVCVDLSSTADNTQPDDSSMEEDSEQGSPNDNFVQW
ncbi:MAG: hypothetical protein IJ806_11310 [Ruminococcus sp.]|nr:hypothetical protein [Ruminococcus sp.]